MRISKHAYFMKMADTAKLRSPDPKTQVGAVLVDKQHRIVSTGYNGPPKGFPDEKLNWVDRESIYPRVVHAEMNAILYAGGRFEGSTLYCTLSPCKDCLKLVSAAGIQQVFFKERYKDFDMVLKLAEEFGVTLTQHEE